MSYIIICISKNRKVNIDDQNAQIKHSKMLNLQIWKIKWLLSEESAEHSTLPLSVRGRCPSIN